MLRTTLGQLLINNALPERLRDYNRVLDKKGMTELLRTVALEHPEDYREISKKLADIGREAATESGGNSFGLAHMKKAKAGLKYQKMMQERLARILDRDDLTDEQRNDLIIKAVGSLQEAQADEILKESVDEKNPLAMQVASGTRGNKMNLASLRGSDVLYTDHRDHVLPLPVVHSFSQGLSPVEYWANTYGARKGVMATKFATQDAGFLSKQLNQIAHRLMVVGDDYDEPEQQALLRGYPTDTNDKDNEGALLAKETGGYPKNTVLTPKILKELSRRGIDKLLVRSPAVGGSSDGGVYARDVGVRERGVMPGRGEQVGLQAAQALSEPLSQAQLAAKHSGGVVGQEKAVGGFQGINQLVQVPETFRGGAAHSEADGIVQRIEPAPAGGSYVYINNQQHYVPQNYELKVKKGERVEAGDVLSEGVPNPYIITKHKGIGEGRRYFINAMRDAMGGAGLRANRRNLEILARGLINHVRLTDEMGDNVADDIVPYTTLEHTHQPRDGYKDVSPDRAVGMYLERPVLHYTIGTKIRPSVVQTLKDYGVESVTAHTDPVAFEPEMIRGMANLQHDPDWQTRLYGSGQKSSLLDAVHRGGSSTPLGTSFVPGLAKAVNFGQEGLVRQPEPGKRPEEIDAMPAKKPPRHALDLTKIEPLAPASKPGFSFSSLLKLSDDASAVRDAQLLMEKVGAELGFVKTAEPGNMSTGHVDRQPAAPKPNTNSPLHAGAGNIPGSNAPPPQQPGASTTSLSGGTRAQRHQASVPAQPTVEDPNAVQQRRNAQARYYSNFENQGGYTPGRGIYDPNDSIEQIRNYIGDPNQGFSGGQFGAAVRLFNMIDPNAVGTLTRGPGEREEYKGLTGPRLGGFGAAAPAPVAADAGTEQSANATGSEAPWYRAPFETFVNAAPWIKPAIGVTREAARRTAPFVQPLWNRAAPYLAPLADKATKAAPWLKPAIQQTSRLGPIANVGGKVGSKALAWLTPILDTADILGVNPIGEREVGSGVEGPEASFNRLNANMGNIDEQSLLQRQGNAMWQVFSKPVSTAYGMGSGTYLAGKETGEMYDRTHDLTQQEYDDRRTGKSRATYDQLEDQRQIKTPEQYFNQLWKDKHLGAAGEVAVDAANEMAKIRGVGTRVGAELTDHSQSLIDKSTQWMVENGDAVRRWIAAGKPEGDWIDPQTGRVVNWEMQRDFDMHAKRSGMSAWELKNQGQGFGDRVMNDVVTERPATWGDYTSGQARIPGTNRVLPSLNPSHWGEQWQNTMPTWLGGR